MAFLIFTKLVRQCYSKRPPEELKHMTTASIIINTLIAYGACQAFFIVVMLLRSRHTSFKVLLAILLTIEGVTLIERLLVETELIVSVPHLLGISHPISFLKPPLLLFMAMAVTIKNFKLNKQHYWHLTGFVLMLLVSLPFYFLSGLEKLYVVANFMTKIPSYSSVDFYFTLSFFVYMGAYIYLSLKKLNTFRHAVRNNVLANWYSTLLMIYAGFLIIHLAYFLIQPLGQFNFAMVNQVSMLVSTFIIQSIAFKIFDRSTIFNSKPPDLENLSRRQRHENAIISQFKDHQVFLNDELNLSSFSETVELPSAYVSEIIHQKFNCSFKTLVNQYRLEEAKRLIQESQQEKIKLIDIAFKSGFNNKVSFYRAFKTFEGISPSDYVEKIKTTK